MQDNVFDEIVEDEIDVEKIYSFPEDLAIEKIDGKYLVIYTKGILWLVLENDIELSIFKELRIGKCIKEVLEEYDEKNVVNVITQIEAKKFEEPVLIENKEKNMYIYLTNNCNERCKHCYMYAGEISFEELSIEEWKKVISDFKNNGGNGITFTGGEVTVYKGFEEILEYSHKLGLITTVLSNGILWDRVMIEKSSKYINEIQISIDGYDKDSYYEVRQYDGFNKALSTIKEFSKMGTRVSMAVTPLYDNIEKFILGFKEFAIKFMKEYPNVFIKLSMELLDGRQVKSSKVRNNEYREQLKSLMNNLYPNYYIETFVLNYKDLLIKKNCGFGEISIAPNGNVFWCNRIHELESYINIKEVAFKEILEISEKIKDVTSVENSDICSKCDIKYICGGGCRMNYPNIKEVTVNSIKWNNKCDKEHKISLYRKMIASNEFFYK